MLQLRYSHLFFGLFVCFGLLTTGFHAHAQQTNPDTTRIRYSEETMVDTTEFEGNLHQKLSRFTRLQVEERRLLKIGLTNFSFSSQGGELQEAVYGLNFIYEQKLRTQWSVLAELTPEYVRYRSALHQPMQRALVVESQLAGRYYYNLNKRIRKGKSASNFSANYLSVALGTSYGRAGRGTPLTDSDQGRGDAVRASLAVVYGLQRRLGRYGFVDFNAGLPLPLAPTVGPLFPDNTLHILLNLRLGLALGR